jgi:predicted dehydrogenase
VRDAVALARSGAIGEILVARAWNVQYRPSIGHDRPSTPPAGLDYENWVGPAPMVPYQANRLHYGWHWFRNFGTGDAGNDGVHELDIARWGLGVETLPTTVAAVGGKYHHDDDQEFPDTMTSIFEFPGTGGVGKRKQLIFEMRLWSRYHPETTDNGNEFLGTEGRIYIAKRGDLRVFDREGRPKQVEVTADRKNSVADHMANFLDAIRGDSAAHADATTAHLSSALPHLANLSARLGRSLTLDPSTERITGDSEADAGLGRSYRTEHWAAPRKS